MKTSSAKAKGRRLQQAVASLLQNTLALSPNDVKSLPMGSQGADVWLSEAARYKFPFAVECKNTERINLWAAWKQTLGHAAKEGLRPLLAISKNREDVLVVLKLEDLLKLCR